VPWARVTLKFLDNLLFRNQTENKIKYRTVRKNRIPVRDLLELREVWFQLEFESFPDVNQNEHGGRFEVQ